MNRPDEYVDEPPIGIVPLLPILSLFLLIYEQLSQFSALRLHEHHAQRQAKLDRQIRIDGLTTRRHSRWCRPQSERVIADPDRQITASPQAFIVLGQLEAKAGEKSCVGISNVR